MHANRSSADHPASPGEPMRPEDVRRMLSLERVVPGPATGRRRVPRIARKLVLLLAMFGIYVLSIGPLYWKWYGARAGLASPIYIAVYRPLEILADIVPAL